VFVKREVHDALMQGPEGAIELFHGYTYSGHPVACAAGLATLEIYAREDLFARCAATAPLWEAAIHGMADLPHVIDIRNIGLMGAIELAPRDGEPGARGYEILVGALKAGLLVRATGDVIALSPPLIASSDDIGKLFSLLRGVLSKIK
jgi:beta-alanine--pyruvate transaminase